MNKIVLILTSLLLVSNASAETTSSITIHQQTVTSYNGRDKFKHVCPETPNKVLRNLQIASNMNSLYTGTSKKLEIASNHKLLQKFKNSEKGISVTVSQNLNGYGWITVEKDNYYTDYVIDNCRLSIVVSNRTLNDKAQQVGLGIEFCKRLNVGINPTSDESGRYLIYSDLKNHSIGVSEIGHARKACMDAKKLFR